MKNKVPETKIREVKNIQSLIRKYKVVGIIDLTNLPSPQLQSIRKQLKSLLIKVSKKRLMKIALENLKKDKKDIEKLEESLNNIIPSLIFTNENSFKLAKELRKRKSMVSAKPGQIAPKDIIITSGPTPFTPGPIIGELGALGIKAAVDSGKIAIKEDFTIVKEGEKINNKVASILTKLGIEPMEIGLNLIATYENGTIFKKDVLDIDEQFYIEKIKEISLDAFKLSLEIGYITKENIEFLLKKAYFEAEILKNLKEQQQNKIKQNLAQADKQAKTLKEEVFKKEKEIQQKEQQRKEKLEKLRKEDSEKLTTEELIEEVKQEKDKEEK